MIKKFVFSILRINMASALILTILFTLILVIIPHTSKAFLSGYNIDALGRSSSIVIMAALSQLLCLSIGQFNLAVGSMGCLAAMLSAHLMEVYHTPIILAVIAGILISTISGAIQGLLITKTGINPWIVTLSLTSVYLGIILGLEKGYYYQNLPVAFKNFGGSSVFHVPVIFILAIVIGLIFAVIMDRTTIGRQLLATGANVKAAAFSGINTSRVVITAHTLSGFLAGIGGIFMVARMGFAISSIGSDWMIPSVTAAVLGGTLLAGGSVSVIGTFFGAILMEIIRTGLFLFNINFLWFGLYIGIVLLIAFEFDRVRTSLISIREK